jgi:RNA polymerase sigma-B factor
MAKPLKQAGRAPLEHTPRALRRSMPTDTPATAELWRRYLASRDQAAFQALCEHYAPLAFIRASMSKRSRPAFYREPLEDLLSDGLLGLVRAIQTCEYYGSAFEFRCFALGKIRSTIRDEVFTRSRGKRFHDKRNVVERARAELTREHGRSPTRAELVERLSTVFTNPNIQIGEVERGGVGPLGESAGGVGDPSASDPADRLLGAEAVRLAMKGLKGEDRKILRLILAGQCAEDIAKVLGLSLSSTRARINGALWECRCRADLAAYLDVEPAQKPTRPPRDNGKKYERAWALPAISALGPARRVS